MTLRQEIAKNPYLKVSNCTDKADLFSAMDDLKKLEKKYGEENKTLLAIWGKIWRKLTKLEQQQHNATQQSI